MFTQNFNSSENEFETLDAFLEMLSAHYDFDNVLSVANVARMKEFQKACIEVSNCIKAENLEAEIEFNIDPHYGMGTIKIKAADFVFHNINKLFAALKTASNFEIYPLNDGYLQMNITFHSVMSVYVKEK